MKTLEKTALLLSLVWLTAAFIATKHWMFFALSIIPLYIILKILQSIFDDLNNFIINRFL